MESTTLELSGDGDGYGYGYGYGSGDGYGDGSGDGYGYGSGDEKQMYLKNIAEPFQKLHPQATLAFWRSNADGTPANGGSKTKASIGLTEEVTGPLRLCSHQALHGTLSPDKWKGERWWIVALHNPTQEQDDKMGSLKRTIVADLGKCPF